MTNLLNTTITAPISLIAGAALSFQGARPRSLAVQATFTYGSGGTAVDAWVQTSFDGGTTWIDIAQFHFTTASATRLYNLSALTPVSLATPGDGTLAANTAVDGLIGSQLRVKRQSTGTYAGGTTLRIDVVSERLAGA